MIIDIATAEDIAKVLEELAVIRAELAEIRAALPPRKTAVNLHEAAKILGVDPRTAKAMLDRGQIHGRRAGRRILIELASLKPKTPAEIARLAAEARR